MRLPTWIFVLCIPELYGVVADLYRTYYLSEECLLERGVIDLSTTGANSTGRLRSIWSSYPLGVNCSIILRPPTGSGVTLAVQQISLRKYDFDVMHLFTGCRDYLQIYGEEDSQRRKLCDEDFDQTESLEFYSNGNLTVQFFSEPEGPLPTPDLHVEVYFTATTSGSCQGKDRLRCDNGRCIWAGLTCDGHNNCGDKSDEAGHHGPGCYRIAFPSTLVIAVVSVALAVLAITVALLLYYRRRYWTFHFRKSELLLRHNLYPRRNLLSRKRPGDKDTKDGDSITFPSESSVSYGPLVLMVQPNSLPGRD